MVAAIGAVAGVAGAAISANGAQSAADTQSAAGQQSAQMQAMAAAQQRADLAPWTQAGGAAQSKLNQYLGIGGVGSSGVTSMGLATGLTPAQVREQLLSRYTKQPNAGSSNPQQAAAGEDDISSLWTSGNRSNPGMDGYRLYDNASQQSGGGSGIDEEGLNAAIQKYYDEQDAQNKALQSDPTYGSLLTPFHNGAEFDPGPAFSFTGQDLKNDPGYQFGLDQGTLGIDRGQAARGNYLSGAAMKELTRFNEDYAGTKFNEGFNRASSTYNTNLTAKQNAWNTNLNAYDNNRSRIYSFLTGVSTLGQNSAAQVGTGNQQAANNSGNALMQGANAQSAGQVASGNALQSGINGAVNTYNWNNMLSKGGGYSGSNGYSGNSDPLGNMINANNGWNSQV
ncbi:MULTISPECIES: hypothetical protein [unclassified Variovorax]|uniref:hypothetical protein n=1 Tax=unclassified Variovorax TaxID=663243 RepID=UPI003F466C45